MAEVSNIGRFHQQNQPSTAIISRDVNVIEEVEEEEAGSCVDAFDFDSFSPPDTSFVIPSKNGNFSFTTVGESEPSTQEFESVHSDHNFFFYAPGEEDEEEDNDDQMNFVTDLFETRQGSRPPNERNFIQSGYRYMDEEPELVLGLESTTMTSTDGLRIVDMDSESDSEAMEVDSGSDHDDGLDPNDDFGSPGFWDCLQFHVQRERASLTEEFEWEEVSIRENLTSLIDRIEQLSISSFGESSPFVTEEEEENARNVEWQVLLAINNLELGSGYDEYNVQFGELVEGESSTRGSPPAAKSVVENLPSVVLTMEDLVESNMVCAVCKDDISVGVKVTKLPCCHHYHKDCIVPWLAISNSCPLCRRELLTDDIDYERRKNGNEVGAGLVDHDGLGARHNYQLLP